MKMIFGLVLIVAIIFISGCADFVVKDKDGVIIEQGQALGFGRDLVHTKTISTTTTIVQGLPIIQTTTVDSISSTSNVANVLNASNQILGTAVDAFGKMKP